MVSKITIFEGHLNDIQFGPTSIEIGQEDSSGSEDESVDDSSSKSRLTMFLQGTTVFVIMFTTLWVLLSRLLSGEESE